MIFNLTEISIISSLDKGMYSAIFFFSDATALHYDILCLLVDIHIHTVHVMEYVNLHAQKNPRGYSSSFVILVERHSVCGVHLLIQV